MSPVDFDDEAMSTLFRSIMEEIPASDVPIFLHMLMRRAGINQKMAAITEAGAGSLDATFELDRLEPDMQLRVRNALERAAPLVPFLRSLDEPPSTTS